MPVPRETHLITLIRELSRPALPALPELPARFQSLLGKSLPRQPRAVLFDVYGTLFTSTSGDISTDQSGERAHAIHSALSEIEKRTLAGPSPLPIPSRAPELALAFEQAVTRSHQRSASRGIHSPEIDVRKVWRRSFAAMGFDPAPSEIDRFAVAYEACANPVWPMPHAADVIRSISSGAPTGIVSNAQFYTPLLFPALLEQTLPNLGFHDQLVSFSYAAGYSKPNPALFEQPLAALTAQGIDSEQVVYVGNDMLNDIATAAGMGCMTVLFAGDVRSLRLRETHTAVAGIKPHSVVRSLEEAASLILA